MRAVFARFGGGKLRDLYGPIGSGKCDTGLAKFNTGSGRASGVFCGVGAVGAAADGGAGCSWPQHARVSVANSSVTAASRGVEGKDDAKRANGILLISVNFKNLMLLRTNYLRSETAELVE